MGICILDANDRKKAPLSRRYPENAVGLQEPAKEIIDLLEWGSERNAIAIMLHGFGGIGKTTLADAVFSLLDIQECKYSTVQLQR
jgi:Mg-chelatase subunit ChlI